MPMLEPFGNRIVLFERMGKLVIIKILGFIELPKAIPVVYERPDASFLGAYLFVIDYPAGADPTRIRLEFYKRLFHRGNDLRNGIDLLGVIFGRKTAFFHRIEKSSLANSGDRGSRQVIRHTVGLLVVERLDHAFSAVHHGGWFRFLLNMYL